MDGNENIKISTMIVLTTIIILIINNTDYTENDKIAVTIKILTK